MVVMINADKILDGQPERWGKFGDLGTDGRTILKWI
jgi:hypothetical protein